MDEQIIRLPGGDVRVRQDAGVLQARGLRYATAQRFRPPVAIEPWNGEVDATQRGAACPQVAYRFAFVTGPVMDGMTYDEDCLTVTVTAPVPDGRVRPVMVWFHGGAYISGSGEMPVYDPRELVVQEDVVVVTVNYRLGILGYLAIDGIAPANLGLLDQILALRWVQANIAAFGGDPDNVTIVGHSAGADSVFCLLIADGTVGLFRRAILQSMPFALRTRSSAMVKAMGERAREVLARDGAHPPIERVLKAQNAAERVAQTFGMQANLPFGPQMGQAPLPPEAELADRIREVAQRVDVMLGATKHDVTPFLFMNQGLAPLLRSPLLGRLLVATLTPLVTRRIFMQPARKLARQLRSAGGKATVYRFDWAPRAGSFGACHCIEVPFLLGAPEAWTGAPMLGSDYEQSCATLGHEMRSLWAGMARSGIDGDAPAFVTLGAGN